MVEQKAVLVLVFNIYFLGLGFDFLFFLVSASSFYLCWVSRLFSVLLLCSWFQLLVTYFLFSYERFSFCVCLAFFGLVCSDQSHLCLLYLPFLVYFSLCLPFLSSLVCQLVYLQPTFFSLFVDVFMFSGFWTDYLLLTLPLS